MPITPLHLGPGLLCKAAAPTSFSLSLFAVAQGILDLEPIVLVLTGQWPLHRFFHTPAGATVAAFLTLWPGKPLAEWAIRWWNRSLPPQRQGWRSPTPIPWGAAVAGAVVGAYSHLLLDAVMHSDVAVLAPFSPHNPFRGWVTMETLNLGCLVAGGIGGGLWWWRRRPLPATAPTPP